MKLYWLLFVIMPRQRYPRGHRVAKRWNTVYDMQSTTLRTRVLAWLSGATDFTRLIRSSIWRRSRGPNAKKALTLNWRAAATWLCKWSKPIFVQFVLSILKLNTNNIGCRTLSKWQVERNSAWNHFICATGMQQRTSMGTVNYW